MRLIFVRHGEPDYGNDCLTPNGEKQADLASLRLEREGISEIYASPLGRARQTAEYTSKKLNIPIKTLEFMHEITWGGEGLPENGHPWILSGRMILEENFDYANCDWKQHPYFKDNAATRNYEMIISEFEGFLVSQGYRYDGRRFYCETDEDKTIALFSHGGSGGCVISWLMNLSLPFVFSEMPFEFTSISILNFPVKKGAYVYPRLELFNDTAHTAGVSNGLVIQKEADRT